VTTDGSKMVQWNYLEQEDPNLTGAAKCNKRRGIFNGETMSAAENRLEERRKALVPQEWSLGCHARN
jgi:hypothetical protein